MSDKVEGASYEQQVEFLAKIYTIDAQDIADAYKDRPLSLKTHFNAKKEIDSMHYPDLGPLPAIPCIVLGVFVSPWTLAATVPLMVGGLLAYSRSEAKLKGAASQEVATAIRERVNAYKAEAKPPVPRAP